MKISALTPFLSLQNSIGNCHISQQKLYPNAAANIHPCEAELLRRAVCRQSAATTWAGVLASLILVAETKDVPNTEQCFKA